MTPLYEWGRSWIASISRFIVLNFQNPNTITCLHTILSPSFCAARCKK
ncbi:hypothetical protein LEP1GSC188_4367 [Leptospira weilii serovar Topaz str. LT2116]|uniref:Uncharacterized protein n=1 Tax=Leptospira weilii serovar Topaz str. LT2116 TaxID=1088540 RepID=M3H522_9LEPT|nr:hypothetical protein LEP1GSC188_4367 [Leptospira weilii serovar Topaz str. LT2116]